MRIQHNILAMNAYRNYNTNTSAVAKNLEKLSSGYKINRAGDDAAGLAISEKMRAQITGLNAAQKNVKDGISLVKTAEGAMQEIHDMLNRMDYLATQSANGTYDNEVDRANLQKEVQSLKDEINRIADSANFNGIKLLNGDQATSSTSAVGELLTDMGVDGSNPTAAGAANINFKLTNAGDGAAKTVAASKTTNGGTVDAATKGEITLKFGGLKDADIKITAAKVNNTNVAIADNHQIDLNNWAQASDSITLDIGGKEVVLSNLADANAVVAELAKYGITAGNGGAGTLYTLSATAAGFAPTTTSDLKDEAGVDATISTTTTAADIAKMTIKAGGTGYKIGDFFDVAKDATTGNVTLTAKTPGDLSDPANAATAQNAIASALTGLESTINATDMSSLNTLDPTKIGSAALTKPGTDAGLTAPANPATTTYDLDLDWSKIGGGTTLEIGTQKFVFMTDGTPNGNIATTGHPYKDYYAIDISKAKDSTEMTTALKTALETNATLAHTTSGKFDLTQDATTGKITLTGKSGSSAADLAATNLGEIRSNNADFIKNATYTPVQYTEGAAAPTSPFATATYNIGALAEKSKIYIGDKMVEIVAAGTDAADLKPGQVAMNANAVQLKADIEAAFEAQGIETGKLTLTAPTGTDTDWTMTITGTTIGQTGEDLAKANAVKVLAADATPAASVAKLGTNTITAGTTTVSNIKDFQVDGKKLGDNFTIRINGKEQTDDYKIAEGDEISIVANKSGKLSETAMNNLAVSGTGVATSSVANGYDEGKTAGGDKTTYEISFIMNKLAGGNTFTIGNQDGKSYTFEISYDAEGNTDGTIGATDKDDVVNGGDSSDRKVINLYGKTEAEAADLIKSAISDKLGTNFDMNSSLVAGKLNVKLTAKEEGQDYNLGNIRVSNQSGAFTDLHYNPAGGAANGVEGTYAQVTYKFDKSLIQSGDALTVGGTAIYFGDKAKTESVDGKTKVTVSAEEAKANTDVIVKALESAGYRSGQVRFGADGTMTITGIDTGETAEELAGAGGKVSLSSTTGRELTSGGLKLQIGDTADSYNQMVVSIGSMKTSAMGIGELDISNQAGAQAAIASIKDAINYVSGIRGDLGAIQNRLEHTGNNLSIMAENIQDAESTIRDTDIAEEMMAYTKNNILVQSAQAMLAQANQVPQGVLQLLG